MNKRGGENGKRRRKLNTEKTWDLQTKKCKGQKREARQTEHERQKKENYSQKKMIEKEE
jgi:hypothetical protein